MTIYLLWLVTKIDEFNTTCEFLNCNLKVNGFNRNISGGEFLPKYKMPANSHKLKIFYVEYPLNNHVIIQTGVDNNKKAAGGVYY